MTNSERFVQAHKNTRKALQENTNLNYRVQFDLELAAEAVDYLYELYTTKF